MQRKVIHTSRAYRPTWKIDITSESKWSVEEGRISNNSHMIVSKWCYRTFLNIFRRIDIRWCNGTSVMNNFRRLVSKMDSLIGSGGGVHRRHHHLNPLRDLSYAWSVHAYEFYAIASVSMSHTTWWRRIHMTWYNRIPLIYVVQALTLTSRAEPNNDQEQETWSPTEILSEMKWLEAFLLNLNG